MSVIEDTPDERIKRLYDALKQYHPQFFPDLQAAAETARREGHGDPWHFHDAGRWFDERYQRIMWEFSRPWQIYYGDTLGLVMQGGSYDQLAELITQDTRRFGTQGVVRGRLLWRLRDYGVTVRLAGATEAEWQDLGAHTNSLVRSLHIEVIAGSMAPPDEIAEYVRSLLEEACSKDASWRTEHKALAMVPVFLGPPSATREGLPRDYELACAIYAARYNARRAGGRYYRQLVDDLRVGKIPIPGWAHASPATPISTNTVEATLKRTFWGWLEPNPAGPQTYAEVLAQTNG
jgi:hypothetical protein